MGSFLQVPIVAPFLGCLFGGWLHDMFLYDGESPVNTPWIGLRRLVRHDRAKPVERNIAPWV